MILALDISTTQTGYAVGPLGNRPRSGVFRPKGSLSREERIHFISASVLQLCRALHPTLVLAEQVSVNSHTRKDGSKSSANFMSALALAECHGAIKNDLWKNCQTRVASFNVSRARSLCGIREDMGIKGAPKKAHVLKWLRDQGIPAANGDEADALVIWMAYSMQKTGIKMQPLLQVKQ